MNLNNIMSYNSMLPEYEEQSKSGEFSPTANEWKEWADFKDFLGYGSAARDREFQHNEAVLQRNYQTSSMNLQHQYNKELMDYAEEIEKNKYKNAVEGMKEAGLNPALALSMGGGSVSTPSTSAMSGASGSGSSAGSGSAMGLVNAIGSIVAMLTKKKK